MKILVTKNRAEKESRRLRGFTLAELLVAMTITIVLVSLTVIITGSAIDAWRGARSEIRAAGQAKVMLNALGRDLESFVSRQGNTREWLVASTNTEDQVGPDGQKSPNSTKITFFTQAADRYDGNAGVNKSNTGSSNADRGGDVSAVSYELDYVDPIFGDPSDNFSTFVLYRKLLDPDKTYDALSSGDDLSNTFRSSDNDLADLMCENIYEFTVTFIVEYENTAGEKVTKKVPIMTKPSGKDVYKTFSIRGDGLAPNNNLKSDISTGRVVAIDLSITVLSDSGISVLKKDPFKTDRDKSKWIEENGYRYTRSVTIPQL